MTIRHAGIEVIFGLAIAGIAGYGLATYTPIPDDLPFESRLPIATLLRLGIVLGLGLVIWAHLRANRE